MSLREILLKDIRYYFTLEPRVDTYGRTSFYYFCASLKSTMKTKILTLFVIILFCTNSYSQDYKGFYAKASASIAYPCPTFIASAGYEFNRHLAIGVGVGVLSPAFYDICFPLSIEISGDITKKNILGKKLKDKGKSAFLCYSVEPMIFGPRFYWISPKIGIRTNNCHFYLTAIGVNFSYRFRLKNTSKI